MVFIGGPRQVGKTTLAEQVGSNFSKTQYLNWDNRDDQKVIIGSRFKSEIELVVFDEIHKYQNWKNYIKGIYDKHKNDFSVISTGSARLNIYRKGGDSLMGRYFYYRLHPFSLAEALGISREFESLCCNSKLLFEEDSEKFQNTLEDLFVFGGFPETFLKKNKRTLLRWQNSRLERLVKEDIRDLSNIRNLSLLQIFVNIIPERVASLFSINSVREDLMVNFHTLASWLDILENFYYCFRIYPYQSSAIRSLKKEPKLYLWDYSEIKDDGARFENLISSHLLKFVHFLYDIYGFKTDLWFLRDRDAREVDFLVTIDGNPWFAVEAKTRAKNLSKTLNYFGSRLKIPYLYQVVKEENIDYTKDKIRVISASKFLTGLV